MMELPKDNIVSSETNGRVLALTDIRHVLVNALARIATADPNTRRMMNIIIDEIHKTEQRLIAQRNNERNVDWSVPLPPQPKRSPPPPPPSRRPEPPVKPPIKE